MAGQARQGSWPASATAAGCCSRLCVARRDSSTAASVQYHFSTHCWVACVYHTRLVLLLLHPDIYIQQCPVRAFVVWRDTCILFRVLWFGIVYRIVQDQVLPRYKIGLGGGARTLKGRILSGAQLSSCAAGPLVPQKHTKRLDWPRQQRPSAGSCEIMFILAWSRVWGTAFQERVASRSTVLYFTAAMTRRRTAPDLALCDENELWGVLRRGGRAACGSTSRGRWDYEPKQQVPATR